MDMKLEPFEDHGVSLHEVSRVEGYLPLERVLCAAYDQASGGKGKDRHAAGDAFVDQPIMSIGRLLKSADGEAYQAIKKLREGLRMAAQGKRDAAIREFLGAINYVAAVALLVAEDRAGAWENQPQPVIDPAETFADMAGPTGPLVIGDDSPHRRHAQAFPPVVLGNGLPDVRCPPYEHKPSRDQYAYALWKYDLICFPQREHRIPEFARKHGDNLTMIAQEMANVAMEYKSKKHSGSSCPDVVKRANEAMVSWRVAEYGGGEK